MDPILDAMREADALVLATPVYVDGMSGTLKNCIDRMVPVADPHIELRGDHCRHPVRGAARTKRRVQGRWTWQQQQKGFSAASLGPDARC